MAVDADDALGSGEAGSLNGIEPDAAATDLRRILRGADAGHDAAAEKCRLLEREVLRDLHDGLLVHQHLLRIAGQLEVLVDRLPAAAESRPLARTCLLYTSPSPRDS